MSRRNRRMSVVLTAAVITLAGTMYGIVTDSRKASPPTTPPPVSQVASSTSAREALANLTIKGRASKTGYSRSQFGDGWADGGQCDVRNIILARDLTEVKSRSETDCTVLSGVLNDPYTSKTIHFERSETGSAKVQIDHVVALSDAWQKGAQQLAKEQRFQFANDPLNLLAVDGPTNNDKGDADAATWLPPNKAYRCRYIARQVAVKAKYSLWITKAEYDAMAKVLDTCPGQLLPVVLKTIPVQ